MLLVDDYGYEDKIETSHNISQSGTSVEVKPLNWFKNKMALKRTKKILLLKVKSLNLFRSKMVLKRATKII